jgi:hypothetical protein
MFPMVVTHEQGDFKVNFYDGTWKGGWGIEWICKGAGWLLLIMRWYRLISVGGIVVVEGGTSWASKYGFQTCQLGGYSWGGKHQR